MPVGSAAVNQFTSIDPTNEPATVTNDVTNFGWEYVWHCHILGHEENDMMRAMSLAAAPLAPSSLTVTKSGNGNNQMAKLAWTDGSAARSPATSACAPSAPGFCPAADAPSP